MRRRGMPIVAIALLTIVLSGCAYLDVAKLAGDETTGRANATPGSAIARQYLINQLTPIAQGIDPARPGDAAYTQDFPSGTTVMGVIPGTDLADEFVLVGAHYDHLGSACDTSDPADTICNGATDNATGVAAALAVARSIAQDATGPRRSVVVAFWDREEDGLLGARHYTQHPLVPLAQTVAYVNFDIQGANLRPSLRTTTFAIASESGGAGLAATVRAAIDEHPLDAVMLSTVFGQGRSDYVPFLGAGVPSVFFSDATGPCYHSAQDELGVVDFAKLDKQIAIARDVTRDLAGTDDPPAFVAGTPLATYDDALGLGRVAERLWNDRDLFSADDRALLAQGRQNIIAILLEGRDEFDDGSVQTLLVGAASVVSVLTHGECDGFLVPNA